MVILHILENLSFLVLLVVIYQYVFYRYPTRFKGSKLMSGIIFGLVGLMCMLNPVRMDGGVIYDGRSVILAMAGVFAGPLSAAIAAAMCLAYRVAIGGPGVLVGSLVIIEAAALGSLCHFLVKKGKFSVNAKSLAIVGALVHILMLGLQFLLPNELWRTIVPRIALPVLVIYPVIFVLIGIIFIDALERRREHLELHESEARYRQMFSNNLAIMLLIDSADGKILDANAAAVRFYGWPLEKLKAMTIFQINTLPPGQVASLMQKVQTSQQHRFVMKHRNAEGEMRDVEVFSGVMRFGEIEVLHSIIFDVTEREAALRERDLLYMAIDSSFNEVYMFDADTLLFTYANKGALANLGYSMEAMKRMTPLDLKKDLTEQAFMAIIYSLRSGEKSMAVFSTTHFRADGSKYPVEIRLTLFNSGTHMLFLAIVADISESLQTKREIEAQVKELERWREITLDREDRIIELKREVNGMAEKAGLPPRYEGSYLSGEGDLDSE
jgi:PAS domain S-box-containing protein